MNVYYACEPFPLTQLPPQLTTVRPLPAALNLTTTQVTTARHQRPFTRHSVTTCQVYPPTPGPPTKLNQPSIISSYRTSAPWCFTTIPAATTSIKYSSHIRETRKMARILTRRLTLLLVGADACTTHIINSVWGEDDNTRLALGSPRGDLSLIRQKNLPLSKVVINAVYIWTTNPDTPVLQPTSNSFERLPSTLQKLILEASTKISSLRVN